MSYINRINQFWKLDEIHQFTPLETRLYFYLLNIANKTDWPDEFERTNEKVSVDIGASPNSMKNARSRLIEIGLIEVEGGGTGRNDRTVYRLRYQKLTPKRTPKQQPKVEPKQIPKDERCQERDQNLTPKQQPKQTPNASCIIGTCKKTETKTENNIPPSIPPGGEEEENSSLLKLKDSFSWGDSQWNFIKSIHGISKPDSVIWELIEHVKTDPRLTVIDLESTLRSYIKSGQLSVIDTTEKDLTTELSSLGIHQNGVEEILDLAVGNYSCLRELIRQVKQSKGKITMPQAFIKSKLRT